MDKSKADLRREYFFIRDAFYNIGTGLTKLEIHDLLKRNIFPLLADDESNWEDDFDEAHILTSVNLSLNWLSKSGMINFIEQCKSFINDNLGVAI